MRLSLNTLASSILALLALSTGSLRAQSARENLLLDRYCVTCHNEKQRTGALSLEKADLCDIPGAAETWEKVVRKLRVGAMPPQGMPRPDVAALDDFASFL